MYLYLSRVLKAPAPRTTQVLEINTEWKRDDLLLLLCANLEDPPPPFLLLYIPSPQSFAHSLTTLWTLFTAMAVHLY